MLRLLVLGTLIYLAYYALVPPPLETITIDPETLYALEQQREDVLGRPLSKAELQETIAKHIDEEVLLREAFRRGYDRSDYRTRKRLLTVMSYTIDEAIPAPSRAQLEAYYRDNIDRFSGEEAITFDQVYFAADSDKLPTDLVAFREQLSAGADFVGLGDRGYQYPPPTLIEQWRSRLVSDFGPRVYETMVSLPYGEWTGPVEARGGLVFVRVHERRPLPPPEFDEIESYLRQEYEIAKRRAIQEEKIAVLRDQYRVEIEEASRP